MRKLFVLFLITLCSAYGNAQSLKKVSVSNSGCSLYTYCEIKFETSYSEDSSVIYTGECVKDGVSYGIICVKLLQQVSDLDAAEETLISYLDYLKTSFGITQAAGYGKGHHLADNEKTRGILDYWEDAEKNNWKIKAWTNGKFIGVMYGYSKKELPESKLNVFLDGFRLPGM